MSGPEYSVLDMQTSVALTVPVVSFRPSSLHGFRQTASARGQDLCQISCLRMWSTGDREPSSWHHVPVHRIWSRIAITSQCRR